MNNRSMTDTERLEYAIKLLRRTQQLFWHSKHPEFLDRRQATEDEYWDKTGVAPPGRSVSHYVNSQVPDEDRWANWELWYLNQYTSLNKEIDELIGKPYLDQREEDK